MRATDAAVCTDITAAYTCACIHTHTHACPEPGAAGRAETYDLYAVLHHLGKQAISGHCTANVMDADGAWWHLDDLSLPVAMDATEIDAATAYKLFYRRRGEASAAYKGHLPHTKALADPAEQAVSGRGSANADATGLIKPMCTARHEHIKAAIEEVSPVWESFQPGAFWYERVWARILMLDEDVFMRDMVTRVHTRKARGGGGQDWPLSFICIHTHRHNTACIRALSRCKELFANPRRRRRTISNPPLSGQRRSGICMSTTMSHCVKTT